MDILQRLWWASVVSFFQPASTEKKKKSNESGPSIWMKRAFSDSNAAAWPNPQDENSRNRRT